MKRFMIAMLAVSLAAGCAPSAPPSVKPQADNEIDFRTLTALRKDQPEALTAALTDVSFLVARVGGRREYYFAPRGRAFIRDYQTGKTQPGVWKVLPARFGDDNICFKDGEFPEVMAGKALVDYCRSVGEFVGLAFYLSRGDTYGLGQ